jgi:tRNA A-37 threonylcarbamoyl transferase component Bud32
LEKVLRDLPRVGTLVKDRGYRQVWRFECDGKAYFLKFYPKGGGRDLFRRFFRGSPAMREFVRLQWLQKADIPAPRPVAVMMGFNLDGRIGDAVILDAIEPSVQLDQHLMAEGGIPPAEHLQLAGQIRDIVSQLARAGLGHHDLHLGNFLLRDGKLFLLDAYAVGPGGLKLSDLLMLGHSARRFASLTDLQRGWNQLGTGGRIPPTNSLSKALWKRFIESITHENRYFGKIQDNGWAGFYCKRSRYPHRWSVASGLEISAEDWHRQWPELLRKIQADELTVIKRSRSGDVLGGSVVLNGVQLEVIIKRPRRRYWYRYLNEIGRGSRPRRAWRKAWEMIVRDIPTAWPLLMMQRRSLGYVIDAVFICERVPGKTLAAADLDHLPSAERDSLFHRTGHLLRQIERQGFSHFDAKASNWIVFADPESGSMPVMIDVDGIRRRNWIALGIHRLLRSMHENPQYTPADSLSLCRGYAPFARMGEIAVEKSGSVVKSASEP